jgi:hypothetical protein
VTAARAIAVVALLGALVGACSKSSSDAPGLPPPADYLAACTSAIGGAQDRGLVATLAAEHRVQDDKESKMVRGFMDRTTKALSGSCAEDKWAPEVLKCLDTANTDADDKACLAQLTHDQTEHWHAAAAKLANAGFHHAP